MREQKKWFQHGVLVGGTAVALVISLLPSLDLDGSGKITQVGTLVFLFVSTIYHYRKDCKKLFSRDGDI